MDTVLELRSLCKRFGEVGKSRAHLAVDGVSLAVRRGEFFSLVGPSGCGKTTTLRLIAGLEQATSGDVFLNGVNVCALPPYKRRVSTVFQNYALFPHLTVSRNIAFGLEREGRWSSKEIRRKVETVLNVVQLIGKDNRFPRQLSGGEKQRVALARSLVLEPDMLLLDEPLSALDPQLRRQVRDELRGLQRRSGITFLLVTHDQEEAMSTSDRMAVMHSGRLQQVGTPRELYLNPQSMFVASFLGDVNRIGSVAIRPENLRISKQPPPDDTPHCHATVQACTFLGSHVRFHLQLESGEPCFSDSVDTAFRVDPAEAVFLTWQRCHELVLCE